MVSARGPGLLASVLLVDLLGKALQLPPLLVGVTEVNHGLKILKENSRNK